MGPRLEKVQEQVCESDQEANCALIVDETEMLVMLYAVSGTMADVSEWRGGSSEEEACCDGVDLVRVFLFIQLADRYIDFVQKSRCNQRQEPRPPHTFCPVH